MEIEFEKLELIRLQQESGEWRYRIPNGYTAEIADGFIVIRPAESEDERIRKELIDFFVAQVGLYPGIHRKEHRWLRWLEKQKEQKPVDISKSNNNSEMSDANGHLTGKILVEYGAHAKVRDGKRHCEMDWKEFQRLAHYFYELGKAEQKPAEKQDYSGLNDLERAIHRGFLSAGVENVPVTIIKETAQDCLTQMKLVEWSKEDKTMLNNLIWSVHMKSVSPLDEMDDRDKYEKYEKFLASLPERFVLQPNQEWSEEDEHRIKDAIYFLESAMRHYADTSEIEKTIAWLKSLKNRGNFPKSNTNSPS